MMNVQHRFRGTRTRHEAKNPDGMRYTRNTGSGCSHFIVGAIVSKFMAECGI